MSRKFEPNRWLSTVSVWWAVTEAKSINRKIKWERECIQGLCVCVCLNACECCFCWCRRRMINLCDYIPEKFSAILVPFHRMQCFAIHIICTWYFDFVSEIDNFWDGYICQMHSIYYMTASWKKDGKKERLN